jgi:hypothetical protein
MKGSGKYLKSGNFQPEWWQLWPGIGGNFETEWVAVLLRIMQYIYQAAVITRSGGSYAIHFTKHSPLREVNALLEAS